MVGRELFKTVANVTSLVLDINPGINDSNPLSMTPNGTRLYFSAFTASFGRELWTSVGTAATTVLVSDTFPGTDSGNVVSIAAIGSVVYFASKSPTFGDEVFQTRGTPATTSIAADINKGATSSFPNDFTVFNETLVLAASIKNYFYEPIFVNTRPVVLIDNNRPGYSETGTWSNSVVKGVNNSTSRFSAQATATASWSASTLTPGFYKVEFYKMVVSNSSTAVDIRVTHADGVKTLRTSQAANGPSGWTDLGIYRFNGSATERVVLSNAASGGFLRADAVRFTPVATPTLIDFGAAGYQEVGTWVTSSILGNANSTTRASTTTGASATYTPVIIAGQYIVQIFIVGNTSSTTNAEVTVASNSGSYRTNFNQATATSGWVTLGTFAFDGVGEEYVRLRNLSTGSLRADAVRLFRR